MQTGDLAARAADAQAFNNDGGRGDRAFNLFVNRAIAVPCRADRVAVGAQIYIGQNGVVRFAHQNRLGGGGSDVESQHADITGRDAAAIDRLEFYLSGKIGKRRQDVESGGSGFNQLLKINRRCLVFRGPQRRAQRLEVGGFLRNDQPVNVAPQVFDQHGIAGRPADNHDVPPWDFFEQLQNFSRHHFA